MEKSDELKKMIANTLKVSITDIDSEFSLKRGKLKTSAGSVILGNMIAKVYGQKIDCGTISTFGELLKIVENDTTESVIEDIKTEGNMEEDSHENVVNIAGNGLVCGIDIQEIDIFPESDDYWSESFYTDNFTNEEIAYCVTADSPRHSFAGRWCVKEALHKCCEKYYDIVFKDIQVAKHKNGNVSIEIRKNSKWHELPIVCSISHADNYAVGIVTGVVR